LAGAYTPARGKGDAKKSDLGRNQEPSTRGGDYKGISTCQGPCVKSHPGFRDNTETQGEVSCSIAKRDQGAKKWDREPRTVRKPQKKKKKKITKKGTHDPHKRKHCSEGSGPRVDE